MSELQTCWLYLWLCNWLNQFTALQLLLSGFVCRSQFCKEPRQHCILQTPEPKYDNPLDQVMHVAVQEALRLLCGWYMVPEAS